MGNLEEIIYNPLMEEQVEDVTGWCKETVDYVTSHRSRVTRQIRSVARGMRKTGLQATDVDDIMSELMLHLYKADDYNIDKAINRSSTGSIVSIEGYVNNCVKNCVLRYCSQSHARDKELVSETVRGEDDKELSIFDSIADVSADITLDNLVYDLPVLLKSCEPVRYRFGPDIYLVWYVRLLTVNDKKGDTFRSILEVLGISRKDLSRLNKSCEENVMFELAKAICLSSTEKAVKLLEEYVYSAELVRQAVINQMA